MSGDVRPDSAWKRSEPRITPMAAQARRGARMKLVGVTKHFGDVVAVTGFDLEIEAGEFVSILGQSGSGKSTLLRVIAGLEQPTAGEILIDGESATSLPPEARRMGVVFQDYALFPHMSVRDNLAFPLKMRGVHGPELNQQIASIIRLMSLGGLERRRPSQLSGGQQQRVALGRAMIFNPAALLLDEPLSALDRNLREQMKTELKALHHEVGVTVIYVTHDQSEALALSDRVVVMHSGRIEAVDSPKRLYEFPANRYIASFIGDANLLDATVRTVRASSIEMDTPIGSWLVPAQNVRSSASPGDAVTIVIRPEHLHLVATGLGDGTTPSVRCSVEQILYGGSSTLYVLRSVPGGVGLQARIPTVHAGSIAVGDPVNVAIDTAQSVAIGREDAGK